MFGGAIGLNPEQQASIIDKALNAERTAFEKEQGNRQLSVNEYESTYQALNNLASAYEKMQAPTAAERKEDKAKESIKTDVVVMNTDDSGNRLPATNANAFLVDMRTGDKKLLGPVTRQESLSDRPTTVVTLKPSVKDVDRVLVQEFLAVARNQLNTKYGADAGTRMQSLMKDLLSGTIGIDKVFDMLPMTMRQELAKSRVRIASGLAAGKSLAELSVVRDESGNVIGSVGDVIPTEKKRVPGWSPEPAGRSGTW
jgi:Trk K+ transport system NAD-binding subunit